MDIFIIGGGPGGYVAAIYAAHQGCQVGLAEQDKLGGTCLNRGCIPTKALVKTTEVLSTIRQAGEFGVQLSCAPQIDFAQVFHRKDQVVTQLNRGVEQLLKSNRVAYYPGQARVRDPRTVVVTGADGKQETIKAQNIIIATGSVPALPPIEGIASPAVVTSDDLLTRNAAPPENLVIIGGGVIGLEFATIYQALGSKVTIIEMLDRLLPTLEQEIGEAMARVMRKLGVAFYTSSQVTQIVTRDNRAVVSVTGKKEQEITADQVLVATGRKANLTGIEELRLATTKGYISVDQQMRTSVPGVYAIGDVMGGVMLAHAASAEGMVAVDYILGNSRKINYHIVPNCIFTHPEIGSVGLSEAEAKEAGYQVKVGKFPLMALGKAVADGATEGWVKIVSEEKYGEVLGVHIVGPRATDLIAEAVLAMQLEATAEELAYTIHAHPTYAEALGEAAHAVLGKAIHLP